MKILFVISTMTLMACATSPYKVCDQPEYASDKNNCIQQVQQSENAKAAYWRQMYMANPQAFQVQSQPNTYNYQMPVNRSTQTNCTKIGGNLNCTSY